MGTIRDTFNEVWRDFTTDGVMASGLHEPEKAAIRPIGELIEAAIGNAGLGALLSVTHPTKAALDADLAHPADAVALVYADATDANNDLYVKTGASGAGGWTPTTALHDVLEQVSLPYVDLARKYANADTDIDIAGAMPGERGAKFWAAAAASAAAVYGTSYTSGYELSGYQYVVFAEGGGLLFGVTDDPTPVVLTSAIQQTNPELVDVLTEKVGGGMVGYFGGAGYELGGRAWQAVAEDGSQLGGITDDPFPQPSGAFSPFNSARPEYRSGPTGCNFDLFTRRDSDNRMQVWSVDRTTGTARQLSDAGTDNINPAFDAAGIRATWSSSSADRWPSSQLRSRRLDAAFAVSHLFPRRALLVVGDSVDNGSVASGGNSYAALLSASLSLPLTMRAIGGQQLWQQAMQLGAIPTFVTIPATTIATGGTAVSAIGTVNPRTGLTVTQAVTATTIYPNTLPLSTPADNSSRNLSGWVIDSTGTRQRATLSRTATGGPPSTAESYTITSAAGVAIATASTVVQFIPDNGEQLSYVASIGGGLNDMGQGYFVPGSPGPGTILADVRAVQDAIINALGPACSAFVIQGIYNQASAYAVTGGDADLAIIAHNNERRAKYPGRFVDRFAILAAGGDGSANDNGDIANHWPPRSLRGAGDVIHPNTAGHGLIYNGNAGGSGALALLSPQLAALPLT